MAEPRQMFRFRIPWLSAPSAAAPRPAPPQPSAPEPARSTSVPPAVQPVAPGIGPRPPFRPPGIGSPPPVRYDEAIDRQSAFRIRPPSRPASESGTTSQPTTPPRTPPRSQTTSLSPPPSRLAAFPGRPTTTAPPSSPPSRKLPEQAPPPPPPPAPSTIRESLLRIPASQPSPPPHPKVKTESASLTKESTPTMTTKFEPTAPSEKVVPEAKRAVTPHREHGKGLAEPSGEKMPEKGSHGPFKRDKTQKVPKHHHEGKHQPARTHHNLQAPAGGSSSSPSLSNAAEPPLQKGIKDDVTKLVQKLTAGHAMKRQLGQNPVNVITLAGENQGASMHLSSDLGEGSVHIHRDYKTDPNESMDPTTEEEGAKIPPPEEDTPPDAYINSNVQGVNNSIVLEGSVTERNPGVHVVMSAEGAVERSPMHPERGRTTELAETRRSEFSPTPAERLTYEPIIRRRCLRGLFMESSDSETDDPAKPRRHGCRYGCGGSKDKDVNIL